MKNRTEKTRSSDGALPGTKIRLRSGKLVVPNHPIIPFIEGDGIGAEIWAVTRKVVDAAVTLAYAGTRQISWLETPAGDKAVELLGEPLPQSTIDSIKTHVVAIKGPLGTPTGGGMRSLNVALRQTLDLFSCIRPVQYFQGIPSVVKNPEHLDIVIFRENTEDVYAGIEFKANTGPARALRKALKDLGVDIRHDSGIGIKPISKRNSKRLVRSAIQYALDHGRDSVTIVHKGNIQKFTEGAFRNWGYEVASEEFADRTITEKELWSEFDGKVPAGKVVIKDRIADAMFFELLVRPKNHSVIATTNLNGDYLSDASAGQVGGLGMAPGANIGTRAAIFEATHGTAPDIAGKGLANPCSLILSAKMLLEHIGWQEAADLIVGSLNRTIAEKTVTADLARDIPGARKLSTTEFGDQLIANLGAAPESPVQAARRVQREATTDKAKPHG